MAALLAPHPLGVGASAFWLARRVSLDRPAAETAPTRKANRKALNTYVTLSNVRTRVRRRPGQFRTDRHDAGRVEALDRIIAALDVVEVEGLAEGGQRDQPREIGA